MLPFSYILLCFFFYLFLTSHVLFGIHDDETNRGQEVLPCDRWRCLGSETSVEIVEEGHHVTELKNRTWA